MNILSLQLDNEHLIHQAAQLLMDAFHEHWPEAWSTFEEGWKEIHEMLEPERICRVALDDTGNLLGIIGGISGYDGHVGELHPLAIQPVMQGKGIRCVLGEEFVEQVRLRGGLTITLCLDAVDNI